MPDLVVTLGYSALKSLQQLQRVRVVRTRTRFLVQARHGFQVVVHHVRQAVGEDRQRLVQAAAEVRHQHFDAGVRRQRAGVLDALDKVAGAAVAQVVAVDRGDHHVAQAQLGDGRATGWPARRRRADPGGRGRRRRTGSGACTCRP